MAITDSKPSIVFFGSGPIAAQSLTYLKGIFQIEAVVTKPTTVSQMEEIIGDNAPVYQAKTKSEIEGLCHNHAFSSRIAILVDFGVIISRQTIDQFPLGIINSHFSRLPEWRGADPISFALLSGQTETGVSIMKLTEGMDEGDVLGVKTIHISSDTTEPQLTEELISISNDLLRSLIPKYIAGELQPKPQPMLYKLFTDYPKHPTYTRKLTKEDGILNWAKSALDLEREVRAYITWPKTRTTLLGKDVVITKAHAGDNPAETDRVGAVRVDRVNKTIHVQTSDGVLWIDKLKPAGRQEMTVEGFLAGYVSQ